MTSPLYPHEIWKGNTAKSAQLYRCVCVAYQKFVFEIYVGKDALNVERWKPLDDEADGDGWFNVATAMALTLSAIPKAMPR